MKGLDSRIEASQAETSLPPPFLEMVETAE
jgi:hypothetical protein